MRQVPVILLAEDNGDDVLIFKRALRKTGEPADLIIVSDGQQAIDYLAGRGTYGDRERHPLPSLILLDLKMPFKTGFDVLEWICQVESLTAIPAVVLSSSDELQDVHKAMQLGTKAYLTKPPVPEKLMELLKSVLANGQR